MTDAVCRSMLAAEFLSGIAGGLTDPNGAVIAGARVRIIARSTMKVYACETDSSGENVVDLDPGVYDVEAEATGFRKARRKSIPVESGGRSVVDFVLKPGREEVIDPRHL